jgi:hypothetical protein
VASTRRRCRLSGGHAFGSLNALFNGEVCADRHEFQLQEKESFERSGRLLTDVRRGIGK